MRRRSYNEKINIEENHIESKKEVGVLDEREEQFSIQETRDVWRDESDVRDLWEALKYVCVTILASYNGLHNKHVFRTEVFR